VDADVADLSSRSTSCASTAEKVSGPRHRLRIDSLDEPWFANEYVGAKEVVGALLVARRLADRASECCPGHPDKPAAADGRRGRRRLTAADRVDPTAAHTSAPRRHEPWSGAASGRSSAARRNHRVPPARGERPAGVLTLRTDLSSGCLRARTLRQAGVGGRIATRAAPHCLSSRLPGREPGPSRLSPVPGSCPASWHGTAHGQQPRATLRSHDRHGPRLPRWP
jgi:hypothetical protein